jgi:hypothetical protein
MEDVDNINEIVSEAVTTVVDTSSLPINFINMAKAIYAD